MGEDKQPSVKNGMEIGLSMTSPLQNSARFTPQFQALSASAKPSGQSSQTGPAFAKSLNAGTTGQPAVNFNFADMLNIMGGILQLYLGMNQVQGGQQPGTNPSQGGGCQMPGSGATPPENTGKPGCKTDAKGNPVNLAMVEVSTPDDPNHAAQVWDTFKNNTKDGAHGKGHYVCVDNMQADGVKDMPTEFKTKEDLGNMVDNLSAGGLAIMRDTINKETSKKIQANGPNTVVNGSLGLTRDDIYMQTIDTLKSNPDLAKQMGLTNEDFKGFQKNDDGSATVPKKLKDTVMKFVDQRMDAKDSDYNKALTGYNAAVKRAGKNDVAVVVAAGNSGKLRKTFGGGDTNLLGQSDGVIMVAASDDKGTKSLKDDTIAGFSSSGDGKHNPTIAAKGVNVNTQHGVANGTSFASPAVAATVARMWAANPKLSIGQIKKILQETATDTKASSKAEGAGMMNADAAVKKAKEYAA